uniref:Uncharacterized protein n=1 Tax=Lepeophtheirus salmonis TaxID=72036 RepID=A0A0K2UHE5_LEPSM
MQTRQYDFRVSKIIENAVGVLTKGILQNIGRAPTQYELLYGFLPENVALRKVSKAVAKFQTMVVMRASLGWLNLRKVTQGAIGELNFLHRKLLIFIHCVFIKVLTLFIYSRS